MDGHYQEGTPEDNWGIGFAVVFSFADKGTGIPCNCKKVDLRRTWSESESSIQYRASSIQLNHETHRIWKILVVADYNLAFVIDY